MITNLCVGVTIKLQIQYQITRSIASCIEQQQIL
jgi:hypothetical protein